jgi:predicted Zn-dependent peptidase
VVWHASARSLPVVHVRVVVRAGSSLDGARPGVARLTALALAQECDAPRPPLPGAARNDVPAFSLRASTSTDATVFAAMVLRDHADASVEKLAATLRRPRVDDAPLAPLRRAEKARLRSLALSDAAWTARALAWREMSRASTAPRAHAAPGADAPDLESVTAGDCRAFHKTHYGPKVTSVLLVGDLTLDEAVSAAEHAFGSWDAAAVGLAPARAPTPLGYTRVVVADRPGASTSMLYVASVGPSKLDPALPALWVARQLVAWPGAGPACGSPACTGDSVADLLDLHAAQGPSAFVSCTCAATADTGAAVGAALAALRDGAKSAPGPDVLERGRRALVDALAHRVGSPAAFADAAAELLGLDMPETFVHGVPRSVRGVTGAQVSEALRTWVPDGHVVVVVVGDATVVADGLARYGDVQVVDPADGFSRKRAIPANPNARSPGAVP